MSLANVEEYLLSAMVGGTVTGIGAYVVLSNKLAEVMTDVKHFKESCTACKTSMDKSIGVIVESMQDHHEDPNKHVTLESRTMLGDILARVMRIESKLFNGSAKP